MKVEAPGCGELMWIHSSCVTGARLGWDKSSCSHVSGSLGVKIWHYFFLYWKNSREISVFSSDTIIILTFKMRLRSIILLKMAFEMPSLKKRQIPNSHQLITCSHFSGINNLGITQSLVLFLDTGTWDCLCCTGGQTGATELSSPEQVC